MTIDTENKRRAALSTFPFVAVLPIPDGLISKADREHLLALYRTTEVPELVFSVSVSMAMLLTLFSISQTTKLIGTVSKTTKLNTTPSSATLLNGIITELPEE